MDKNRYMTIDGIPVEINGEKNLLALIRKVGIKMPTFCYHSELSTYGACRMCMVEDQWGTLHASCSTPPKPGMEIRTNTERLRKYRKVILELLLANHCRDCTTCDNNEKCNNDYYNRDSRCSKAYRAIIPGSDRGSKKFFHKIKSSLRFRSFAPGGKNSII